MRKKPAARSKTVQAAGVNDARYAAIIMNPVTGEVYHEKNADARRYPASLTKMMTLYLLFEALQKGKTSLDSYFTVSEYASTMPQTNLSLDAGDSIDVETIIKALVVRSANDVSVVVAEALGGDVDNFASMMTAKARQLGMRSTVFRNPNGLPNSGQYTTARDMAKLGIALKRDFPKYYKYFSTLQFSYNGVTYYTHNRVMLRYAGVDGIKTGFIGASGFNLVTSVTRGGRPLVGTVMGGATGAWRDNRMIQLLDSSYDIVAQRGAVRGKNYPQNLPLPRPGTVPKTSALDTNAQMEVAAAVAAAQNMPESTEAEEGGAALPPAALPNDTAGVRQPVPFDAAAIAEPTHAAETAKAVIPPSAMDPLSRAPVVITPPARTATAPTAVRPKVIDLAPTKAATPTIPKDSPFAVATAPAPSPAPARVVAEPVAAAAASAQPLDYSWGIQVGAFSTQALAVQATRTAMQVAAKPLVTAKMAMADVAGGPVPVHRARLENLTQKDARKACEALIAKNSPCFIYKAVK